MRQRLFVQIYVSFLTVSLLTLVASVAAVGVAMDRASEVPAAVRVAANVLVQSLPDPSASPVAFHRALAERAEDLGLDVSVWSAEGRLLGRVGDDVFPAPPAGCARPWLRSTRGRWGLCMQLPDGRWVASTAVDARVQGWLLRVGGVLAAVFGTIAAGCWPLARRITRRLEALQRSVEAFGQGALDQRVTVEGRDEVALVAQAFNASAERVSALVEGQRKVLAHASHELRSPLARLRMAVALLEDAASDEERQHAARQAVREIGELNELIEDVLLAGRLRGGVVVPRQLVQVDLAELCREVADQTDTTVSIDEGVDTFVVRADERLIRRALHNLVDNAWKYAAPPIELRLGRAADVVSVQVLDRGPGIPVEDRARIFQPFFRRSDSAEPVQGVGLGLSLVDEIARHHGGSVTCTARTAGGMCFLLQLPADGDSDAHLLGEPDS